MKTNPAFILTTLLAVSFFFANCEKDNINCANDEAFCSFISTEDFNKTGPAIDKFLSGLKKDLSEDQKLEKLREWVECKSCVSKAEILCNSCIYTYPPQSEIKVVFIVDGRTREQILDIIMDDPLKFGRFHD
jgi:hypothetical protein